MPPPRSELAGRRPWAVEQGAASDAAWAVFRELRPQFDGLLPPGVVLDCVDHAVRDLLGSICVEALPEMAIRLAAVRLEHHLRRTDGPPGEPPTSCQPPGAAHQPSGASRNAGPAPASAFVVIRPPVPGYRPVALSVAATRAVSWDDAT